MQICNLLCYICVIKSVKFVPAACLNNWDITSCQAAFYRSLDRTAKSLGEYYCGMDHASLLNVVHSG